MGHTTVFVREEVKEKLQGIRQKYRFRSFSETLESLMKVWEDAEKRLGYGGLMEFLAGETTKTETKREMKEEGKDGKRKIKF